MDHAKYLRVKPTFVRLRIRCLLMEQKFDQARTEIRDFLAEYPEDEEILRHAQAFNLYKGSIPFPDGQESNMADVVILDIERKLVKAGKLAVTPSQQQNPLSHGLENQNAMIDAEELEMTNWQVVGIAAFGLGVIFLSGWITKRLS